MPVVINEERIRILMLPRMFCLSCSVLAIVEKARESSCCEKVIRAHHYANAPLRGAHMTQGDKDNDCNSNGSFLPIRRMVAGSENDILGKDHASSSCV